MRSLRQNERLLVAAFAAILGACGDDTPAADGGLDAPAEAPACGTNCCYCFDDIVSCDRFSYSWHASFAFCVDGAADPPNCISDHDAGCTSGVNGGIANQCRNADVGSGDPYSVPPNTGQFSCSSLSLDDGGVSVQCHRSTLCGRRFDGLVEQAHGGTSACGRVLGEMAWLEAASVHAFARLARDLARHGAPSALIARAKRAAREEARHARVMRRLARTHGTAARRVVASPWRPRMLEEIAIENAVEGCARETFGALLAMWQAKRAKDAQLRSALESIAPDELGHAALAWAVAEWAEPRLEAAAAARVRSARDEALAELARNGYEPSAETLHALGHPSAAASRALARAVASVANRLAPTADT